MSLEKTLSISDIAKELNSGKTTIKFILKRFRKWLPSETVDGQSIYPCTTIRKIIFIQGNLDDGVLPHEIEKKLDDAISSMASPDYEFNDVLDTFVNSSQNGDIRLSKEGLTLLKSLFSDIGEQQKRIAIAHEKRAEAEERKAVAIEKRAGAEEKKARAMNNIANALQEMNKLRGMDSETLQIDHEAAPDDRSQLVDEQRKPADIQPLDDLSALIDEASVKSSESEEIDDLSRLIDSESTLEAPPVQKDEKPENKPVELDNLSKLIDDPLGQDKIEQDMDDLSQLIDESSDTDPAAQELDDLASLIDSDSPETDDDLSRLIDDEAEPVAEPPEIKIDISPEEDRKKYKSDVMKTIIGLKTDGLSVEETTQTLNKNRIKTLSGKPEWSQKAISQIYKFIESAQ